PVHSALATLSLHDALPISNRTNTAVCLAKEGFSYIEPPENRADFIRQSVEERIIHKEFGWGCGFLKGIYSISIWLFFILLVILRSEEHTSELQSRENLVCR